MVGSRAGRRAVWGAFQGSGKTPYQVRVDLSGPAWKCSCPSRKLPCKHALGLLLGAADDAGSFPDADPPDWVAEWLNKRESTAKAKATKAAAKPPSDPAAKTKRREAREAKVAAGLDGLERWLDDLVRGGLAELDGAGPAAFERQAARLVDAQAPGLAARLRGLAEVPNSGPDWPARLLDGLASTRLLCVAYRNQAALPDGLREDVRTLVGWGRKEAEIVRDGESVDDLWVTLGSVEWEEDRVRGRRTWLHGAGTGRTAELVQFAPHGRGFAEHFAAGLAQPLTLAFAPSAAPRRAVVVARDAEPVPVPPPPGTTVAGLLGAVADELAACPFRTRFGRAGRRDPAGRRRRVVAPRRRRGRRAADAGGVVGTAGRERRPAPVGRRRVRDRRPRRPPVPAALVVHEPRPSGNRIFRRGWIGLHPTLPPSRGDAAMITTAPAPPSSASPRRGRTPRKSRLSPVRETRRRHGSCSPPPRTPSAAPPAGPPTPPRTRRPPATTPAPPPRPPAWRNWRSRSASGTGRCCGNSATASPPAA